jgi:tetratricopeptide (TPR) repeat protein
MVPSSHNTARRRLWILIASGLALLGMGCVMRFIATDRIAQWRAERLPAEALAKATREANAPFPFVFEWAKRLEASARFAEAERVYSRAMEIGPTHVEAWLGFGRTAFAARDWGRSSAALGKTVEQWPDNAEARFTFAAVLASTFRVRKAIEQMKVGVKLNPDKGEAFQTLGDLEMRAEDYAAAVEAYAHAKALMPKAKRLQSRYGAALVNAGKYVQAQAELEAALKDDPSDINARFDMGRALARTGKEEDRPRAMQELNRVVEFSQNKSRAYMEAARIWLREGDRGNAIQGLEHAFDLNPYNPEILKLLAQAYADEGRQAEAQKVRKALDQAQTLLDERNRILSRLEADEEVVVNLIRLGRVDRSAHNLVEAQSAFEAASFLDPGNTDAARELKTAAQKFRP